MKATALITTMNNMYVTATAFATLSSSPSPSMLLSRSSCCANVRVFHTLQPSNSFRNSKKGSSAVPRMMSYDLNTLFSRQPSYSSSQRMLTTKPTKNSMGRRCEIKSTRASSSPRLFFSQSNNDNEDSKSILKKVGQKLQKFVPSFLKKDGGKITVQTKREKAQKEISSSIDTMLKDAPLGLKLVGKMISPIISSVAGSVAQAMAEQQDQIQTTLNDAKNYILSDSDAIQALGGEPIYVNPPFSQSSSSMSVNGKTSSRINLSFEVGGSTGSGIASMDCTNGKIDQLVLNVNGRRLNINVRGSPTPTNTISGGRSTATVSSSANRGSGLGKNRVLKNDEIIDVEFVDKKVDK